MDKENADEENAVVGSRDLDFRIDDTTDSDHHRMEKETDKHKTKETATNSDKADSAHVVLEKLKIETGTDGEETEKVEADNGNDDDDTDVNEDNNDDWIANLNDNYEDDNDGDEGEEEEEEYLPAKGTRTKGTKRKSSGLKLSIRKGKSGKKAKKPPPSETQTKIILSNIIPSTSTAQLDTERNDNVEKEGTDVQTSIVKTEAEEAPVEESNIDLGLDADADRTALEIELQETDDIDHYETVHKSLSPDEQFSKPSDVRESDGFSPSLGCYYCHDCGYTFQLQRWYKIHKWDGRCVYTCQVCSQQFTFRNITAYREHMKTHK